METAGSQGEVVEVLPPPTVTDEESDRGLGILGQCVASLAARQNLAA
ncbi:hypothetical protein ABZ871_15130 [Streptomyces populi]